MMTFDCKDELAKIKAIYPEAELVIRVLVDDSYSVCKLGTKYGCPPKEAADLLEHAKTLQLNVIGVSFHVGSGCQNALAYTTAVSIASDVFGYAEVGLLAGSLSRTSGHHRTSPMLTPCLHPSFTF